MNSEWRELDRAVAAFRAVLERETDALHAGDAGALERLAAEKQACLDTLGWAVPDIPIDAMPDALRAALTSCRQRNRDNAEATATRLEATRRMLDDLGRLVGLEPAPVYRADGRRARSGYGRTLGSC